VISTAMTTQDGSTRISTPPIRPSRQAPPSTGLRLPRPPQDASHIPQAGSSIPQMGDIPLARLTPPLAERKDGSVGSSDRNRGWSSSQSALVHSPLPSQEADGTQRDRVPWQNALSLTLAGTIVALLIEHEEQIVAAVSRLWMDLLFWTLLILAVNLMSFEMDPLQFTLDMPLLLTAAVLYPPAVAALVALVGSTDIREFNRGVSLVRAVYNRSQIALSVFVSGLVFGSIPHGTERWPAGIVGTVLAMGVFYLLNAGFVATFVAASGRASFGVVVRRLAIGRPLQYALTYFGYGMLALVLARLFADVGPWSVALFLIPIVVAHLALVRAERLGSLASSLQARERLLERLSEQIVDERRDERLRIAGGLHDDVLQSLIRISQLGSFLRDATDDKTEPGRDALELVALSAETIETLREVVGDLKRSPVGRGGLVRTLRGLAQDLRIQWRKQITVEGPFQLDVSSDTQLAAYHVAKEGLLNALKHANASSVSVRVQQLPKAMSIEVQDDGQGFDPGQVDESVHFGLGLMRERVELLGGRLEIRSASGWGSRLTAFLPAYRIRTTETPGEARPGSAERVVM
jgi:signal transduction histidine kinase